MGVRLSQIVAIVETPPCGGLREMVSEMRRERLLTEAS